MSQKDYDLAYDTLFAEGLEDENREYYQETANGFEFPEPKKEDRVEEAANLEDSDEKAMETPSFSEDLTTNTKLKFLQPPKPIFRETTETQAIYNTRVQIAERLKKVRFASGTRQGVLDPDSIDVISRMINNKIWFNTSYGSTEKYLKEIIENIALTSN